MKILVRSANWIGDSVMTVPALREIRRIFPDAKISLYTRTWAKGIFEDADFIDEIITFDDSETRLNTIIAQSKILRAMKFDLAVIFPNSFASALPAKFAAIPKRYGYSKDARQFLLTNPFTIPDWKNTRHEVFYYLNLVAEIEKSVFDVETVLSHTPDVSILVSEERKTAARNFLAKNGVFFDRPLMALGVGSTNSRAKRWGAEKYAALNDRLQRDVTPNVIIIGGDGDAEVAKEVVEKSKINPINLTGKTDLELSVAILSVVHLLVSNDMGLAHIAPSVGTQTLVIFGPTNPVTTRPFSENAKIFRNNVECSPCMLRDCPIDHRCMAWITADEIFDAAVRILAKTYNAK